MKNFTIKIISYGIFTLFLLCIQIGYAENVPTYFIGLQPTTHSSENTPAAVVYICTPMESSVHPPYICAPASIPVVSFGTNPPSAQPQTTPYLQTLKTPNIYHYSTYSPLESNTSVYSTLPKYRPYDDTDSIDTSDTSDNPLSLQELSDSLTRSEPASDSWSPTSDFTSKQPSQDIHQNSWYSSPVYPHNPYIDNFSSNVWQNKPQYRPDKNIPSTENMPSTVNPFSSQPIYQGQIKYQYVE